jgi:hypothetical protein
LERFSSEVDAGSREENASKKEIQSFDGEFNQNRSALARFLRA